MLVLTFCFWTGITVLFYLVNHVAIWVEYGWWLFLMIFGTYFLFMDVRLMVMIMRHEEKKKWRRYRLKNKFEDLSDEDKNALLIYKSRLGRAINSLDIEEK